MNKFMFCQKWLTGLGMYLTVFGIVLAVFPQSALMDSVFNNQIDPQFWQSGISQFLHENCSIKTEIPVLLGIFSRFSNMFLRPDPRPPHF